MLQDWYNHSRRCSTLPLLRTKTPVTPDDFRVFFKAYQATPNEYNAINKAYVRWIVEDMETLTGSQRRGVCQSICSKGESNHVEARGTNRSRHQAAVP